MDCYCRGLPAAASGSHTQGLAASLAATRQECACSAKCCGFGVRSKTSRYALARPKLLTAVFTELRFFYATLSPVSKVSASYPTLCVSMPLLLIAFHIARTLLSYFTTSH